MLFSESYLLYLTPVLLIGRLYPDRGEREDFARI